MNKRRIALSLASFFAVCIVVALLSCGKDECPTCPKDESARPYKGWLFVTSNASDYGLFKIDAETGEAVDSIPQKSGDQRSGYVDASQDGRYVAVSYCCGGGYSRTTVIYDAQTLAVVHEMPFIVSPLFISSQNILLGFAHDTVFTFSIPTFDIVSADSVGENFGMIEHILDERDTLVYGNFDYGESRLDSVEVAAYNYVRREITRKFDVRWDDQHKASILHMDFNRARREIYFTGANYPYVDVLASYSIQSGTVTIINKLWTWYGWAKVSPDGKELYVTDPGPIQSAGDAGTIYIFDAASKSYLGGISLWGYRPFEESGLPLAGGQIVFTPTGERAFVLTGRTDGYKLGGSVLTIDTKTRQIVHLTWPECDHYPDFAAICPKLVEP